MPNYVLYKYPRNLTTTKIFTNTEGNVKCPSVVGNKAGIFIHPYKLVFLDVGEGFRHVPFGSIQTDFWVLNDT